MSKIQELEEFFATINTQSPLAYLDGDTHPYSFPFSHEDDVPIDLSRVREFCLSDGGLIDHRFRAIAWLSLCQLLPSDVERSARLREKGLIYIVQYRMYLDCC